MVQHRLRWTLEVVLLRALKGSSIHVKGVVWLWFSLLLLNHQVHFAVAIFVSRFCNFDGHLFWHCQVNAVWLRTKPFVFLLS